VEDERTHSDVRKAISNQKKQREKRKKKKKKKGSKKMNRMQRKERPKWQKIVEVAREQTWEPFFIMQEGGRVIMIRKFASLACW